MNLLRSVFFFTVFFLAFSGTLSAQNANLDEDMNEAIELYKQGKYSEAFSLFEILANDPGNEKAKEFLGMMYRRGQGVKQDYKKAFSIYNELAKKRNTFALNELAILYYNGLGVKANPHKAFKYYQLSDKLGDPFAHYGIGYFYMVGTPDTPRNLKKAEQYIKGAARKGLPIAQTALARLYLQEDTPPPTPDYEFVLTALKAISPKDYFYCPAQVFLGIMYDKGKGVPTDKEKAMRYFNKVADSNNASALGSCAYYMIECNANLEIAKGYIQKAMSQDLLNGSYIDTYGYILYKQGKYKEALEQFQMAMKYSKKPSLEIKKHIGDAYHVLGEDDKALTAWSEALAIQEFYEKLKSKIVSDYITTAMKQQRKISLATESPPANAD